MSVDLSLRFRRNFGTDLSCVKQLPKMIDFLFESYERFLQEKEPNNRKKTGLELIFSSVFPIESIKTGLKIEYVRYEVGEPAFSEEECKDKSYTYSVPLCLFLNVSNEKSGIQSVEKKIYLGELPQMCDRGCFLVNGVYRAVVSQLKKSPGVLFCEERGKNIRENSVFAKIMPNYGSWIQFLFDFHSLLFFRIDNKKKIKRIIS